MAVISTRRLWAGIESQIRVSIRPKTKKTGPAAISKFALAAVTQTP